MRPAAEDDWPEIEGLLRAMGFAESQSSEQLERRVREIVGRDDHCLCVAAEGENLLGYAWAQTLGPHLRSGDAIVRLHDRFVREDSRCAGVGRSLFDEVRTWAEVRGARWLQWHAGTGSVAFYESLGFFPTPSEDETHPFYEIEFES